jgi:hypothetical protein
MALAAQQSLLDELMGKGRNAGKGEQIHQRRFDDDNVGIDSHRSFIVMLACLGL